MNSKDVQKVLSLFLFFSVFISVFIITSSSFAQVSGIKGDPVPAQVVEWKDMIARDQARAAAGIQEQPTVVPIMRIQGKREIPSNAVVGHTSSNNSNAQTLSPSITITPKPLAPSLSTSFQAAPDNLGNIPPDTMGAAGPNHLVVTHNGTFRILDKFGNLTSSVSLNSFWGRNRTFDPKIYFDEDINRFITFACVSSQNANSAVLVAVSSTSDPTQAWYIRSFDADSLDTTWADFPSPGFNQKWIAVGMNMFTNSGNSFQGAKMWVLDKTAASSPGVVAPTIFSTAFDTAGTGMGFTLYPCHTFGTQTDLFILDSGWASGPNDQVRISKFTGPTGSPSWAEVGFADIQDFGFPPAAPQFGNITTIDSGDTRIMNAVFRNGCMWYAQTGGLPTVSPNRSVALWHQVSTNLSVIQQGVVEDNSSIPTYYFYPSIAVTANNDVGIGFSGSNSTGYCSAYYTARKSTDSQGSMQTVSLLKAGQGTYVKTFGSGDNRWGDYSQTCIDPVDGKIWTIQEYADTPVDGTDGGGRWATWWGKFDPNPPLTNPPVLTDIPDLKLFINQGLNPAFDLADYNTGGIATSYSVSQNFAGLSGLSVSVVTEASFASPTTGINNYVSENPFGTVTSGNKVKYSSFKIQKLEKVGITAGSSWDVNVASLTISTGGSPIPNSFGINSSITISDLSKVTAFWVGNSVVRITSLATSASPVNVDIIASPAAGPPYGADIDKERIIVCSNLLPNSTFSTGNDTTFYGLETTPGKPTIAALTQSASVADFSGVTANGVITYTFAGTSDGVKATPLTSNRVNYAAGQWYTGRIRLFSPNVGNTHQALIFNFSNDIAVGGHIDVAANVYFGIPTTWTWIEVPLYSNETGIGYIQYQLKASSAGSVSIDEIQIVNCAPTLVDASRGNTRLKYSYADYDVEADTTGWGQEGYPISTGPSAFPTITGSTSLHLNFGGATGGSGQKGIKWTANNGVGGSIYTPTATPGRQIGTKVDLRIASGNFNTLSAILLLANFGVASNGNTDFFTEGGQLIASAEFGRLTNGTHYDIGVARRVYNQFQFAAKNDQAGELDIDNTDFLSDNDDPNYGDATLFP